MAEVFGEKETAVLAIQSKYETEEDEKKKQQPSQDTVLDQSTEEKQLTDVKEVEAKKNLEDSVSKLVEASREEQKDLTAKPAQTKLTETPQEEMQHIQNEMDAVETLDFMPMYKPVDRMGMWAKFKNRLKVGVRFAWQATLGGLINGAGIAFTSPVTKIKEHFRKKGAQDKRDHNMVPGREGEVFGDHVTEYDENGVEQVYSDVRRGPLVWEKLSAGDPEEPPEVSILVEQSKRGSRASYEGDSMGHTMIGLSYSRYNKTTKRKERYQLRMGFYPAAGTTDSSGTLAMTGGALMPGQLVNDEGHHYDVARRYRVSNGDINKILRAAETYADGGYGYFSRNCTTFAMDMAHEANLPIVREAKPQEMEFKGAKGLAIELAEGISAAATFTAASDISSRMQQQDQSYMNFGQKRFTKEDLDRYYSTVLSADTVRKGYSPGALGEVLRRSENGDVDAYYKEDRKVGVSVLGNYAQDLGITIWALIKNVVGEQNLNDLDGEINVDLLRGDEGLVLYPGEKPLTADQIRQKHKAISERMKRIRDYYNNRLKNDSRFSELIMHYLSLCEAMLTYSDSLYSKAISEEAKGDIASLRGEFLSEGYELSYLTADKKTVEAQFTSGLYEGYLMAGKTPKEAITEVGRLLELNQIKDRELTEAEEAERTRLLRTFKLASDFASANRYLMWKKDYTDKDIDYAFFELPAKEKAVDTQGERVYGKMTEGHFASAVYKGTIFEKFLDGMKDAAGVMSENLETRTNAVDQYIMTKVAANPDYMKRIIASCKRNMKDASADDIFMRIFDDLFNSYLIPVYAKASDKIKNPSDLFFTLSNPDRLFSTWLMRELQGN